MEVLLRRSSRISELEHVRNEKNWREEYLTSGRNRAEKAERVWS